MQAYALSHVRRAKDLADARFADPIPLDDLAAGASCSKYHLVRSFRAAYGETPFEYLSRRRVERAMALLRDTDVSVTEACHAVGFTSLGTFSRRFKELAGVAPTQYRAMARGARSATHIPACFAFIFAIPEKRSARPAS